MGFQSGKLLEVAAQWLREDGAVALATVIETWGSAPRGAGSHMVVRQDGRFAGSVSGGCVEGAIIEAAAQTLRDGELRRLEFGVQDDAAWNVGLACGGRIAVLVERISGAAAESMLAALNAAGAEDRPIVRAVNLSGGGAMVIDPARAENALERAAASAVEDDRSRTVECDGAQWFLRVYNPPVELFAVGAVHIAQALSRMAVLLGYRVCVIDPRSTFATPERFPGVTLAQEFPDDVLGRLTGRNAVVVLSHDPKIDDPALAAALRSPAFYVGALGSKRTHAARLARLKERGFSDQELGRIHGPVGLAIGARTPEEIAVSILAEITAVLRTGRSPTKAA